jgi:hypothetical protein
MIMLLINSPVWKTITELLKYSYNKESSHVIGMVIVNKLLKWPKFKKIARSTVQQHPLLLFEIQFFLKIGVSIHNLLDSQLVNY